MAQRLCKRVNKTSFVPNEHRLSSHFYAKVHTRHRARKDKSSHEKKLSSEDYEGHRAGDAPEGADAYDFTQPIREKMKTSIEGYDLGRCVVPRLENGKILQFSHGNPLSFCVLIFFSWDNPAKPPKSLYGDTVFVGQNDLKPRFRRFRNKKASPKEGGRCTCRHQATCVNNEQCHCLWVYCLLRDVCGQRGRRALRASGRLLL